MAFASVASQLRRSNAATTDNVSFTFGAAGDFGTSSEAAANFKAIGASNPKLNFFVTTGDLINGGGKGDEAGWCKFAKSNMGLGDSFPFEIVSGNHDNTNNSIDAYVACMPNKLSITGQYGKQYYFDYPATNPIARFVLASPGISGINTSVAWTQAAIKDARAKNIKWVIAVNHKTYLTAAHHPADLSAAYFNMLVSEKVDLILEGHDHTYQRSKQLALSSGCTQVVSKSYKAACVSDTTSDGKYTKGLGSVLVIGATGGKNMYAQETPANASFFEKMVFQNAETHGFTRYTVTSNAISGSYVRAAGNAMSDTFSITAPGSASPTIPVPVVTPITPTPAPTTSPTPITPTPTPTTTPTTTVKPTPATTTTQATTSTPQTVTTKPQPTITLTKPLDDTVISGTTTLEATVGDMTNVQKVEFYADDMLVGAVQSATGGTYRYDFNTAQQPNGNYMIQAKAVDTSGVTAYSTEVPVSITNTHTSTAATFTVPNSDKTTESSVAVAGNCSENVSGQQAEVPSSLSDRTIVASIGFSAKCTDKGGTAEVSINLGKKYENADDLKVFKDQSSGSAEDITIRTTIENRTVGEQTTTFVIYTVKDGSTDDIDGTEDGSVMDPVYVLDVSGESHASAVQVTIAIVASLISVVVIALVAKAYLNRNNQQYS